MKSKAFTKRTGMVGGTYKADGPTAYLRNRHALLRGNPDGSDTYLVQFDDRSLDGAFGWLAFDKDRFELDPEEEDLVEEEEADD